MPAMPLSDPTGTLLLKFSPLDIVAPIGAVVLAVNGGRALVNWRHFLLEVFIGGTIQRNRAAFAQA